jgi:cob(I)alamin adenosyltransferase
MKVYTRTGDKGLTSLVGGARVKKDHQRIEAYGSVDELISFIAFLRDQVPETNHADFLLWGEDRLMVVSSILACNDEAILNQLPAISDQDIVKIENEIDRMDLILSPLTHFVLPGGALPISSCHIARTVCRRAEREIIRLSDQDHVDLLLVKFVNRLSDYLFTLSRCLHRELNVNEIIWKP